MVPKETSQASQDMCSFTQQIQTASFFSFFFFLEAELIYSGLIVCIIKGFNTYIFFLGFFSSVVYFKMLTIVPCAIHWDLAVYSTTSSVPGTVLCLGHPQNRHVRA